MKKISRLNKTQSVYEWVFEKIGSIEYGPGFYLNEYEIARCMKVNRSSVREALNQLKAEGLVEKRNNYRMYVTQINKEGEQDFLNYRAILEAGAAMLTAQLRDNEGLEKLKQIHKDFQYYIAKNMWSQFLEANKKFHLLIVELSKNSFLIDTYRHMHVKLNLIRSKDLFSLRLDGTIHEHGTILSAIEAGDASQAYQSVLNHLLKKTK